MISYEWDVEEIVDGETEQYEDEEILDHWHHDTYAECVRFASTPPEPGRKYRIVLVRDKLDSAGSVEDRSWAYLKDGKLPEYFEDAYQKEETKVPMKFHREVSKETQS